MIVVVAVVVLVLAVVAGVAWGRHVERRTLWARMMTDKQLGHEVLEQLAKSHGAKLELVEL